MAALRATHNDRGGKSDMGNFIGINYLYRRNKDMQTTTINIPIQIPQQYNDVEQLKEQLTRYALYIIANSTKQKTTKKKSYAIDALCGVIPREKYEGEYVEEYLKEKYGI